MCACCLVGLIGQKACCIPCESKINWVKKPISTVVIIMPPDPSKDPSGSLVQGRKIAVLIPSCLSMTVFRNALEGLVRKVTPQNKYGTAEEFQETVNVGIPS